MRLEVGEVLVKRGGRRVTVRQVYRRERRAVLAPVKEQGRSNEVRSWPVDLGDDGLPVGYVRAPAMVKP